MSHKAERARHFKTTKLLPAVRGYFELADLGVIIKSSKALCRLSYGATY